MSASARPNARARAGASSRGASFAAGYRGARYVSTSVAEALPDFDEKPAISVVPGRGAAVEPAGLAAGALVLAKVCAIVFVSLALIAVVRVAITSAAAACALETKAIEQGNDLEVAQSMLSNPSRIKHKAESLGMAAPSAEYTDHIVLPEDIVIVDAAGKLSLSQSIAAAAAQE